MIKQIAEHRSIRRFTDKPISSQTMEMALTAATRASTTGGMQLYSIIVSEERERIQELAKSHYNQIPAQQAAALVTFCADVNRFSKWCKERGAEPAYHNFGWWANAATDAILASQNFALEAANQGLGICYLGTISGNAEQIIDLLELPYGVIPITTIAVGYADENPPLTPRLPLKAVLHRERYSDYSTEDIERLHHDIENYEPTTKMVKERGLPSYAHFFTDLMYHKEDNLHDSKEYFEILRKQGFIEF